MIYSEKETTKRIEETRSRIETDGMEFLGTLFRYAEIRIMAAKYVYYNHPKMVFMEDLQYDIEETNWYIIGRAIGALKEDETSPCIDWDPKQRFAPEAKCLGLRLMKKR